MSSKFYNDRKINIIMLFCSSLPNHNLIILLPPHQKCIMQAMLFFILVLLVIYSIHPDSALLYLYFVFTYTLLTLVQISPAFKSREPYIKEEGEESRLVC